MYKIQKVTCLITSSWKNVFSCININRMRRYYYLFLLPFVVSSCFNNEASDEEMLQQDRDRLNKEMYTDMVAAYKFCKIMSKAGYETDTTSAHQKQYHKELRENSGRFLKYEKTGHLSPSEYLQLYKDYRNMKDYIVKTDEDKFPLFSEVNTGKYKPMKGAKRKEASASEHTVFSLFTFFSPGPFKDATLYECAMANPELLPKNGEDYSMIRFFRGYVFTSYKYHYIAEDELTRNIEWIEDHKKNDYFLWSMLTGLPKKETRQHYLAANYLFRGYNRMLMTREIDQERSLEDMEEFLDIYENDLGIHNTLTIGAHCYVYLRQGETDKAIASLKELKGRPELGDAEKEMVQKCIDYLEKDKKDTDEVLDEVFDKLFLGKVAMQYVGDKVAQVDASKFLKKMGIKTSGKMAGAMTAVSAVTRKIGQLSDGKQLREAEHAVEEESKNLWEEAKDWF